MLRWYRRDTLAGLPRKRNRLSLQLENDNLSLRISRLHIRRPFVVRHIDTVCSHAHSHTVTYRPVAQDRACGEEGHQIASYSCQLLRHILVLLFMYCELNSYKQAGLC